MMGIYFIFVIQLSIFFFVAINFNLLTSGAFSSKKMAADKVFLIAGIILLSLFIFDTIRFGRKAKVNQLSEKYLNDPQNEKIKTWHIFMLPILIIFFTILEFCFLLHKAYTNQNQIEQWLFLS